MNQNHLIQKSNEDEKPNGLKGESELNVETQKDIRTCHKEELSEKQCCYRKDYLDFSAKLIWPVFILVLLFIFRKYVFKILDLLVGLVPKIKSLNAAGIEISFKDSESYVQEFVKDVAESKEDQQVDPSPYEDLNEAYRASQDLDAQKSMMALAKMKAEIILFEELAIKQLSKIVKREIVASKTISLSGKKLSIDGYFSLEGTFWLIEVKMLKKVDVPIITKFLETIRSMEEQKSGLSSISNRSIVEVRGILIIPSGIEIKPVAKTLMISHRLVVYELDKSSGQLVATLHGD